MKKILALIVAALITGCTNTSFMDKALVGDIDGKRIVMFDKGNYYKPQFDSECPIPKDGELVCMIPKERMSNVHSFRDHQKHVAEPNTTKAPPKFHGNYNRNEL